MGKQEIGERIRTRRIAVGWTEDHLAELANLDTSTVSRIETGRHPNPSAASVLRMMRVLELTVIEVIGAGVRTAPPG